MPKLPAPEDPDLSKGILDAIAWQNSDRQNARIEDDKALLCVTTAVMRDDTELFKQFMDNASFKRWLTDTVYSLVYEPAATSHTRG